MQAHAAVQTILPALGGAARRPMHSGQLSSIRLMRQQQRHLVAVQALGGERLALPAPSGRVRPPATPPKPQFTVSNHHPSCGAGSCGTQALPAVADWLPRCRLHTNSSQWAPCCPADTKANKKGIKREDEPEE